MINTGFRASKSFWLKVWSQLLIILAGYIFFIVWRLNSSAIHTRRCSFMYSTLICSYWCILVRYHWCIWSWLLFRLLDVIPSFSFVLFSPGEKKREVNYLWQWVIEISIITQPIYKLCTQRETKVGMVLSRKITYWPLVNLLNDLPFVYFCLRLVA